MNSKKQKPSMDINENGKKNYRWIILLIGVLAQITFSIGFSGIAVSGVVMQDSYHFTINQLGFVLGCMGLGVAISEMVWGVLTDKLGDKTVLILGLLLMALSYGYISIMCVPNGHYYPDYRYLGVMLIITGMVGGSINSSSGHAVMNWFDDNKRGFAMSVRQTAIPIGAAIGSIIIPYFAATYSFEFAFRFLMIISFVSILFVIFGLKTRVVENQVESDQSNNQRSPYKRFKIWKIALAGGALTVSQMAVMSFGSVFLTDAYAIPMFTISVIISFIQLGGGFFRIVTGLISDKYQNRVKLICIISVIATISGILLTLTLNTNVYVVIILLVILGVAGNSWHGIAYTEIAVKSGIGYSGRGLGMMGMSVFTISFLTPYVIPFILERSSWQSVWMFVAIISILALPLMYNCESA